MRMHGGLKQSLDLKSAGLKSAGMRNKRNQDKATGLRQYDLGQIDDELDIEDLKVEDIVLKVDPLKNGQPNMGMGSQSSRRHRDKLAQERSNEYYKRDDIESVSNTNQSFSSNVNYEPIDSRKIKNK